MQVPAISKQFFTLEHLLHALTLNVTNSLNAYFVLFSVIFPLFQSTCNSIKLSFSYFSEQQAIAKCCRQEKRKKKGSYYTLISDLTANTV